MTSKQKEKVQNLAHLFMPCFVLFLVTNDEKCGSNIMFAICCFMKTAVVDWEKMIVHNGTKETYR